MFNLGWHSYVNSKAGHRHFSIWKFIEFIAEEELKVRGDSYQLEGGFTVKDRKSRSLVIDEAICKLTRSYTEGQMSTDVFLERISRNLAGKKLI